METSLELRLGIHCPTSVRIPTGIAGPSPKLSEPPAIEGYISRVKPSGSTERIYLSTHDSHLFLCRPSDCYPPPPPSSKDHDDRQENLPQAKEVDDRQPQVTFWDNFVGKKQLGKDETRITPSSGGEQLGILEEMEIKEKTRCLKQIRSSRGYIDLTGIITMEVLESGSGNDVGDIGGEAGLQVSTDRDLTRKMRTLVLTLKNGRVIKFEVGIIDTHCSNIC